MKNINLDYYICPQCHNAGEYDITEPGFLIICDKCGYKDSYVRCNNCGVEGNCVKSLAKKNYEWTCEYCDSINILDDDFYRNPIRISYKTSEKNKENENTKFQYKTNIFIYLILYCIIILVSLIDNVSLFNLRKAIELLGIASFVLIIGYFGLKIQALRFNATGRVRNFIERLKLTWREIIAHIVIVIVVAIVLSSYNCEDNENNTTHSTHIRAVDSKLITAIEEEFERTDITKIVKFDDKYIITFSDKSMKVFQLKGK